MLKILITGGTGFIGSHTCISLLEQSFKLVVLDSCINSDPFILDKLKLIMKSKGVKDFNLNFYKGDIRDKVFLENIFLKELTTKEPIDGVIHFAGLKSVNESVENPFLYWDNNVIGSLNLFKIMDKFDCRTIVFSSSATIYGISPKKSIMEDFIIKPINPYGHTKVSIEYMLNDIFNSSKNKWRVANLRYFNPIGAHKSGLIGENPSDKPNNLFPNLCMVAQGIYEKLNIYGDDWETDDGTCIRDYIHVMDLADAHLSALNYLSKNKTQIINFNIGTGKGTSVLGLVKKFCSVNNCEVPYVFCKRRSGDISSVVADNNKAITILNWMPKRGLDEMCEDGWRWQINNQKCFS